MNAKQNAYVEKLAKDAAAANRPSDWRLTPISEKSAARVTCPFRNNGFAPDNWWEETEPRWPDGTKVLGAAAPDPFLEYSKQNKSSSDRRGMKIVNGLVSKYAHDRAMAPVAPAFEKFLPGPNEVLTNWLPEFVQKVNVSTNPYFTLLRSYIEKFPRGSKFRDVNEKTVRTLVETLCEGGNS